MAELKTKPTQNDVIDFLNSVENKKKREDAFEVLEMMKEITQETPVMWGKSIIGFGNYHYKYKSGREGDWFLTGFSPRKQSLTIYIMPGFRKLSGQLEKLGKFKHSVGCLYINKLEDVDLDALKNLIKDSVTLLKRAESC